VLYVVGQGMRHGARKAIAANLGILSGNAIWFAASGIGLAALIAVAAPVFNAIRWLGVLYLTWLGISAWRDALRGAEATQRIAAPVPDAARMWRQGLLLQLANPKAILFFTALLPQFVDAAQPVASQIGILAATSITSEFVVLASYGWLAARGGELVDARPRLARATDAAAGTCLVGAGAGLAFVHPA
jgi:threonine/homoserine/homoserine lactone efflux protein